MLVRIRNLPVATIQGTMHALRSKLAVQPSTNPTAATSAAKSDRAPKHCSIPPDLSHQQVSVTKGMWCVAGWQSRSRRLIRSKAASTIHPTPPTANATDSSWCNPRVAGQLARNHHAAPNL